MRDYGLLDGLYKYRMEHELILRLMESDEYQVATRGVKDESEQLEQLNLTMEQTHCVDDVVGAHTHLGNVYGEEAYKLGFWDGIQLMVMINKVAER